MVLTGILATTDQDAIETRALRIYESAELRREIEATRVRYRADSMAGSPDGMRTLNNAVDEIAWAAALVGVNTEPDHSKIGWVYTAPRTWRGRTLPGSRWAADNPDNVYRIAPVDGQSRYEINVRRHGTGPVQFSFMILSHFMGEDGHAKDVDRPLGGLRDADVVWTAADGFTITIDPEPAGGRPNHIQSTPDTRQLLIRNTLGDWERDLPLAMAIRRVGGPQRAPASDEELAWRSARLLNAAAEISLAWKKQALFGHWCDNSLCAPYGRGGHWGFAASGNFKLGEDEALVVTLDPIGAHYMGFTLTDLWLASLDHVERNGSLNTAQAEANADGSFTYVIAPSDPGVHNWLDTSGLREGSMLVRWQALPPSQTTAGGAVREIRRVRMRDLAETLPARTKTVDAAERGRSSRARAAAYARRYEPAS